MAFTRWLSSALLAVAIAFSATGSFVSPVAATEIRYIVNDQAITNYDVARRVALLKLMRRKGNLQEIAKDELINQILRRQKIAGSGISVNREMIDEAYANFASSNDLSTAELDKILAQTGVTKEHFQNFMSVQIGWGRLLQTQSRSTDSLTEQEVVQRILEQGGQKPKATEYMLQQVIFVVPPNERSSILGKRKREAQALRSRFNGCESTIELAKGMLDVTVRDMGRVLEPELPADWKDEITSTGPRQATPIRVTDRGVEFIGVCSAREVSDDHVAKLVFQNEASTDTSIGGLSEELTADLRKNANIIER